MQKLTDEIFEIGKNSKNTCIIYNEDYILLSKVMPFTDDKIDDYIESIKYLKSKGINVTNILDYRLIPETKKVCNNGQNCYTKGIYLVERAKGYTINSNKVFYVNSNDRNILFDDIANAYMDSLEKYIVQIEIRSNANQSVYDKFLSDYLSFNDVGLAPDIKQSNFFYDNEIGYTIVNPVPRAFNYDDLAMNLLAAIFGYCRTVLFLDDNIINCMTRSMHKRLFKAANKIIANVTYSLRKMNYPSNLIKDAMYKLNNDLYLDNIWNIDDDELSDIMVKEYRKIKKSNNK